MAGRLRVVALLGLALLAPGGCARADLRDPDGVVVDNRSSAPVTVTAGAVIVARSTVEPGGTVPHPSEVVEPSPAPVTVEAGATALIPLEGCLWRDVVVASAEQVLAELEGPVCRAELVRIPATGTPYLEADHS